MRRSSSSATNMNPHWKSSQWRPNRRELLMGLGSFGLMAALPKPGEAQVLRHGVNARGSADACIFINLAGAPSHVDTFDLKLDAYRPPSHVIGGSSAMALNATLFPKLAQATNDICL